MIGPPARLSADEYHRRRVEPLRHNADLIGIRRGDIDAIEWDKGEFQGSSTTFEGSLARGQIRRDLPRIKHGEDARPGWEVRVDFQRDGVVSGFAVASWGPPVEICTKPVISEAQARAAPDLFDPSARKNMHGMYSKWQVTPGTIVDARLGVHRAYDDTSSVTKSNSVTYRLVWAIDGTDRAFTFFVDAGSGQLVDLYQDAIVN
jgi:hypothetical protein